MTEMLSVKRSYMHTCHFIGLNNWYFSVSYANQELKGSYR